MNRALWLLAALAAVVAGLVIIRSAKPPAGGPDMQLAAAPLSPDAARALPSGGRFRECAECPQMVVVPAGSFMMGSPADEGSDDERPHHQVTIARRFAVGRTEVTFAEWDACAADGVCPAQPEDNGWGRGARPVTNVSWDDTRAYLGWLSRRAGHAYRLLSEAEWEYAARAGAASAYPWGREIGEGRANCRGCGSQWDWRQTAPAGSFAPNAFGLHDMIGNVLEWCEDGWHETYEGAPADGSEFAGGDTILRVMRGGSWVTAAALVRSAYRDKSQAFDRSYLTGFRVARSL